LWSLVLLQLGWLRKFMRWMILIWETNRPPEQRDNPQLAARLYRQLLNLLDKRGCSRKDTQTPQEFAASLSTQPSVAAAVQEFTDLYQRARFGDAPCDAFRLRALLEAVRSAPRPS
jgi:hypothetical protein